MTLYISEICVKFCVDWYIVHHILKTGADKEDDPKIHHKNQRDLNAMEKYFVDSLVKIRTT